MIYVRRDASIIPEKVLKVAERAQRNLEGITDPNKRRIYIKCKSQIWRAFAKYLAKMSYGKCWYTESPDPQSFFDVDHFRPKLEAIRGLEDVDNPAYEWLTFSWDNFRYAANCANRRSTNHETGAVEGKGSWFPLADGSVKANWDNRCEAAEMPILIDPCNESDVALVDVSDDGRVVPSKVAVGTNRMRVERSAELYGLNLPRITEARLRLMRDIEQSVTVLDKMIYAVNQPGCPINVADEQPIKHQIEFIKKSTLPKSPYALAARIMLRKLGMAELCAPPEEMAP